MALWQCAVVGPGASSGSRRRGRPGGPLPELRPVPQDCPGPVAACRCGTGRKLGKQTTRSAWQAPSRASPGPTGLPWPCGSVPLWDRAQAREADDAVGLAGPFPSFARSHRIALALWQRAVVGPGASSGSRRRGRSGGPLPELRPVPQDCPGPVAACRCSTGRKLGKQTTRSAWQAPSRASPGPTGLPWPWGSVPLWDRAQAREADDAVDLAGPFPSFARSHRIAMALAARHLWRGRYTSFW